jgi:signal transduction histidine kinase/ligand-binding sensor domain-containing protein/CheY-like chemotaxis protein
VIERDGAISHVDLKAIVPDGRVNAIALVDAGNGAVYAGTRHGLLRIDAGLRATLLAEHELSDSIVYGVVPGRTPGELWLATRHGLDRRNGDGSLAVYVEQPALPGSLPANNVFDAMRDREGTMWFATTDGGVARLPATWRNFALFRNDPADDATLSSNRTLGMAFDRDGAVWAVNSERGIDRLDPESGYVERLAARFAVPERQLWSVLADAAGQLWIGQTRGLRVYDLATSRFDDIPVDAARTDALAPGLVYHLVADRSGAIWADAYGGDGAVHRIDARTHRVERFGADAGLRDGETEQLGFGPHGDLLVASGAGLDRFDAATRRFAPVAGAPAARVYAFAFAGDGTLWLHRLGAIEHYRAGSSGALQLLERVDAQRGWPELTLGGLQVEASGAVWVASPRGLWRYDPATRGVRRFDVHDGLASAEFNRMPLLRRADGAIFGGTLAGIVAFDPAHLLDEPAPAPPLLDAIVVRREGRDLALDARAAELALRWNDRDLRLTARTPAFMAPDSLRYRWKLHGVDAGWVETDNRGAREFAQLAPGTYRLDLLAAGANGRTSAPAAPLRIAVARPPWATPLAFAAYALLALVLVGAALHAYRIRVRRRYTFRLARQQRQLAEQTSAAKSEFLATMGHEIRTPMTGVLGMAELLLRTPLDAAQRGYAQTILDSGRLMLRLVNDSLDLARIEAGRLVLEDVGFDLRRLLAGIATLAEPLARGKGLDWVLDVAADAPGHLRGDPDRIKQILLNLLNNAIKFTERGEIVLHAGIAPGGALRLRVRDSGPGISAAARDRLFERFEQTDGGRRLGGSGLGLAICRELVARMGGAIALESEPGRGSTFIVDLPLAPVDQNEVPRTSQPAPAAPAPVALHILLVEDDGVVAEVVAGLLRALGHRVTQAPHGLAALGELDAGAFDAAFVDLDLPGLDGLALARLLRTRQAQSGAARLPLLGLSARSNGDEEALCRAAGMDGFLRKPVTSALLADALADLTRAEDALT